MDTFRQLNDRSVHLGRMRAEGNFPPGYRRGHLVVPGRGKVALPSDIRGLTEFEGREPAEIHRLALLLTQPGAVTPLRTPDPGLLAGLGWDPSGFRNERVSRVGLMVAYEGPAGLEYGIGEAILIENGIRMGSTAVPQFKARLREDFSSVQKGVVTHIRSSDPATPLGPEPGTPSWKTLVALLGGGKVPPLPEDWKRLLRMTAGFYGVRLEIRPEPDGARRQVIQQLRNSPPNGLLIWDGSVADPNAYIAPFIQARPGAYAEILGPARTADILGDIVQELMIHLEFMTAPDVQSTDAREMDWPTAAERVILLESDHFRLTDRARNMLAANPYPSPHRMFSFTQALERLARHYREQQGVMNGRLEDVAMFIAGLEIALFDGSLNVQSIQYDGRLLDPTPHVKVDDHKSPDKCGRIYFAVDFEEKRFIVDHIGLHNYGR